MQQWFQHRPLHQISGTLELGQVVPSHFLRDWLSNYVHYSWGCPARPALTVGQIEGLETIAIPKRVHAFFMSNFRVRVRLKACSTP